MTREAAGRQETSMVKTVAGHLASVYREHGLKAFQSELDIILERISELAENSLSDGDFKLYQLAQKLFQALEVPESHFDRCYKQLVEAISRSKMASEKCARFRRIVLSYLAEAEAEAEAGKTPGLAVQVRTYLKDCPIDQLRTLNVDLLADKFGVTRGYLSRCYYQKFDRTLQQAILSERLNRSFHMLRDKNDKHTVQQVAERVGYQSVNKFRKAFKQYCGLNPGHLNG